MVSNQRLTLLLWGCSVLIYGCDDGTTDAQVEMATPPVDSACLAATDLQLDSTFGLVDFGEADVHVEVQQDEALGCIHDASLLISGPDACGLELRLVSEQGAWTVRRGVLSLSSGCGAAIGAEHHGIWTLSQETESTGGIAGAGGLLAAEANGCVDVGAIKVTGLLQFERGPASLELNLNGLELVGSGTSALVSVDTCPEAIPVCPTQACGLDAYGTRCGTCNEGLACVEGECRVWNCPIEGPYGVEEGELLTDVQLKDCDGNDYSLHDLCGSDAAYVNILAGW